ncbi:hypothetical protein QQF64_020465 [Cirrhinus molitorella]|uniref:Uncharacterized protein n=1 Tax=Cirrhinus molitorella TaxID=172907 RepID=A0ABR3LAQ5_9TELE
MRGIEAPEDGSNLAPINDSDVGLKTDLVTINPSQLSVDYKNMDVNPGPLVQRVSVYGNASIIIPAFAYRECTAVSIKTLQVLWPVRPQQPVVFFSPYYLKSLDNFWKERGLKEKRLSTGRLFFACSLLVLPFAGISASVCGSVFFACPTHALPTLSDPSSGRAFAPASFPDRTIQPDMDTAGSDPVRSAVAQQGVLLGQHETRLTHTSREVEYLANQVADLTARVQELQREADQGRLFFACSLLVLPFAGISASVCGSVFFACPTHALPALSDPSSGRAFAPAFNANNVYCI